MTRPARRPRLEPLEDRTAPAAGDLLWTVANPDPAPGDQLGLSLAVSGNLMAVGAPFDDPGGVTDAGSVYVFNVSTGALVATIPNPDPAVGDQFGLSVAVNEAQGLVWVGAPLDDPGGVVDSGTVYAFSTAGGAPLLVENNPSPAPGDRFGFSLGADSAGTFLAIGAPGDDFGATDAGRAYLASFTGGLIPSGVASNPAPGVGDRFGEAVAVTVFGQLLVGAPFDDPAGVTDAGTAYLYDVDAGAVVVTFNNPSSTVNDRFGNVVALGGNSLLALVTAPLEDPGGLPDAGAAYVFDANAGGETPGAVVATLTNPSPSPGDLFGATAAIHGFVAVVGAPLDDPGGVPDAGTAYEFRATTGALLATLSNPVPHPGDQFGAVALQPGRAVVAAILEDATGPDAGAAYVFDANLPPAVTNDVAVVPVGAGPTTVVTIGNDSALPDVGETLTVSAVTQGTSGGVVAIAPGGGSVTYAPPAGFRGSDTFTYTASDGTGGTATATVAVFVTDPSNPTPVATLTGPVSPATGLRYGQAVAVVGNRTVVGSVNGGPVGVYDTDTGALVHTLAPPAGASASFGFSVAVSFDTVVVGDIGAEAGGTPNAGAAYVFDLATGALRATLAAPAPLAASWFGHSVAVVGARVVVGTYEDNGTTNSVGRPGRVYVYDAYSGSLTRTITNPSPSAGEEGFGSAVALAGTTLVVGAPMDHVAANLALGQVYLYDVTTGALLRTLNTPTLGSHSLFGLSVGISAGRVVVGAREAAYVFDAATGAQLATLGDPTPTVTDQFGHTVAISGTRVVVGAIGDDPGGVTDAGAAYLFDAASGAYLRAVSNPAPAAGDQFGSAVAISGTRVLVGAIGADPAGETNAGAAFVFDVNFPPTARDDTAIAAEDGGEITIDALANDSSAPDGGEFLNYLSATQPAHGTVVVGEAFLHYTPDPDFFGTDSFTYTITDLNGGTATATVVVTVMPANDPPTAATDTPTMVEDSGPTVIDVLGNDSIDPDTGETLTVLSVSPSSFGTVTLTGGVVRYTPDPNRFGTDLFTYVVSDGNGGTAEGYVFVTVTPTNDPPTAVDDTPVVPRNSGPTVIDVLANDSSAPDGPETLTVVAVTQPSHGTVTLVGGVVRYEPVADYRGPDSFTYTISDGTGETAVGTVNVAVVKPVTFDTAYGYDTSGANGRGVAAGDLNGDGAADVVLSNFITLVVLLNDGTGQMTGSAGLPFGQGEVRLVDVTGDGPLDIVVGGGFGNVFHVAAGNGDGTFQAPVDYGVGGFVESLDVADLNGDGAPDVVCAVNGGVVVRLNTGAGVFGPATAYSAGPGTNGLRVALGDVTGDGKPDVIQAGYSAGAVYVYPNLGNGTFGPVVSSATGPGTEPRAVAVADFDRDGKLDVAATSFYEDRVVVLRGNGNGTFQSPVGYAVDAPGALTAADLDLDGYADLAVVSFYASVVVVLRADGAGEFEPSGAGGAGINPNDVRAADVTGDGRPDLITAATTSPANVTIAPNSTAVAASLAVSVPAAANVGETVTVTVTARYADGTIVTNYAGLVRVTSSDGAAGLPADLQFTPADNGVKTFTVTLRTPGAQTVSVGDTVLAAAGSAPVTVVNNDPTAADDTLTVDEDAAATVVDVLGNDGIAPDAGETLAVTAVTQPAFGTVTLVGGVVRYTPAADYTGPDSFTYTVSDGNGGTATGTVSVTVGPVNDPPTAADDTLTVAEDDAAIVVDVLANDSFAPDAGETLSVTTVTQPAFGTVTLIGGVVRYAPAADFFGSDTFTYTISDGNGGTATGTVTVTVTPVNDAPTAGVDTPTVAEDSAETVVDVLGNDSFAPDAGETLTVTAVTQPSHGTIALTGGVVRYTPAANYFGSDSFTYTVSDGNGGTATGTVSVTVTPVNDPPTANLDTLTLAEDSAATAVDVLGNDGIAPDAGETLTVTAVTQPAFGTVTLVGGVVRYTPGLNYFGPDAFTYTVSDGNGGTATGTVTVTVTPVNDPPTSTADALTVAEDGPATAVDVLANESSAPDVGETLSVTAVSQPAHGTVTLTGGVVRYTPAADYFGADTFTYTVSDGNGGTATGTVTVTVTPVNDAPTATDDTLTVAEDSAATVVGVLGNDSFAPDAGETLAVTAVTQPAHGTVALTGGVVRYTPAANYFGADSFTYTISDGNGGSATGTVSVTVTPVNDPPVAGADTLTVNEDATATVVDVLGNDGIAPDVGETLAVTAVSQPAHGTVTLVGGVVRYAPAADYFGADSFTYTLSDGNGGTATGTVTVTVTPVNDAPTAAGDALMVAEDSSLSAVEVLGNDSFAPDSGESLAVTAVTQPAHGTVTLTGGVVRYTPAADYFGADSFTYTVSDGNGGTATGTVAVTVTPVNDPPTATDDTPTVAEDSAATVIDVLANDTSAPDGVEVLTVTAVTPPAHGTVTLVGGVVRYAPAADYFGPDTFTYTVSDGNGGTATGTVSVTVTPINDPPVAAADVFQVGGNEPATVLAVLTNDTAAPDAGETLAVAAVTQPAGGGTAAVAPGGGGVLFTPAPGFIGTVAFTYTVGDGTPGSAATAAVTVIVAPPPELGPVRPVAAGGAPDGSVWLTGADGRTAAMFPFGTLATAVRTATGDVTGDGVPDVVAVTGPGTPLRVAVVNGATGRLTVPAFDPFGGDFAGGGFVAAADLDGDGRAEMIVTPDEGGGPRVTILTQNPDGSRTVRANFFGIDDPNFRGGARAAVGDVNGDGTLDVVVAAGFGGGPRTAIFEGGSVLAGSLVRLVADFFAFPGADAVSLRNGAYVAAGDIDGDGFADLVFGGGPGGAPRVFVLSGAFITAGDVAGSQAAPIANFFVTGDLADRGGARVAVTNTDGDGKADLAVGSGAGRPARVRVYLGKDFAGPDEPTATDLDLFGGAVLTDGVYIG